MTSAQEALKRLQEGNQRFASNTISLDILANLSHQDQWVDGQHPFAVILGCSDSRVPIELVFDQGIGDLFVIRVAGNVAASSQIGSIEYAVENLGTRLVVVLGHTQCGAVASTLEYLQSDNPSASQNLHAIIDRIQPCVEGLLHTNLVHDHEALLKEAVRANVRTSTNHLHQNSESLANLVKNEELLIVGAEYNLESGVVEFFDDPSEKK